MGQKNQAINLSCIFLGFFLFSSMPVLSSSDREFNDDHHHEMEFNYVKGGKLGPEHWGEIDENWQVCGKGKLQSPIDLTNNRVTVLPELGLLNRSHKPALATIQNRGHDIMLSWDGDAGYLRINGTYYPLKQVHWHSPSEHTIDGNRFSLEMHMVHETPDNKRAVIGVLFKTGKSNKFLAKMERYIKKIKDKKDKKEKVGEVDPSQIKGWGRKYYRYLGSLTVPPCTEGVVWTVVKKVRTVSEEQIALLKEALHDSDMNARPTQMMNDRTIGYYKHRNFEL